jgi:hypothetical protein
MLANVWKCESTTSSMIEIKAKTVTLTRAEAPCLKSGGGLYSMTSNNDGAARQGHRHGRRSGRAILY